MLVQQLDLRPGAVARIQIKSIGACESCARMISKPFRVSSDGNSSFSSVVG